MGIPTDFPGSKRSGGGEDYSKRQRLGSVELPQLSTNLGSLPLEIMEIVASHLAEPKDLESFSEISYLTKCSVLNVVNIQNESLAVNELQVLSNLNPSKPDQVSSLVDCYKNFLADLVDPTFVLRDLGAQIDVNKLRELQNKLTALATNQVAQRSRALKLVCYKEIASGKASIERINEKYESLKCALVCEALELVIASSVDPEVTRGCAVRLAAFNGHLTVVQALLANGEISEEARGLAVGLAAGKGHLSVVQFLLANGQISEVDRGWAVHDAAAHGHLAIVKVLVENGAISDEDRAWVVKGAAERGYLEIVKVLLANGVISANSRGKAVRGAAYFGHLEIVKVLLANGVISEEDRADTVRGAAENGHLELLQFLSGIFS